MSPWYQNYDRYYLDRFPCFWTKATTVHVDTNAVERVTVLLVQSTQEINGSLL